MFRFDSSRAKEPREVLHYQPKGFFAGENQYMKSGKLNEMVSKWLMEAGHKKSYKQAINITREVWHVLRSKSS